VAAVYFISLNTKPEEMRLKTIHSAGIFMQSVMAYGWLAITGGWPRK